MSDNDNNIINLEEEQRRRAVKKQDEKARFEEQGHPAPEPMFNIMPQTKILCAAILLPFLAVQLMGLFYPDIENWLIAHLGFTPAILTNTASFDVWMALSFLTYNFLHAGWLHVAMNLFMCVAFASGVEKYMGGKRLWALFFLSSLAGVLSHTVFNLGSDIPMIGASAGISGLFGGLLIIMMRYGMLPSKYGIWPFILLWVGISVIFGLINPVDAGGEIAWIAHLGGFGAGVVALYIPWFKKALYTPPTAP